MAKANTKEPKTPEKSKTKSSTTGDPKFPYATTPNALRKFLEMIPNKPKPPKINEDVVKSWGLKNTNDRTIIRVLKALKFVSPTNEPTDRYVEFMSPTTGPAVLAEAVREVWAPLFVSSHEPYREDDSTLRNYFNIHSGGSEGTIALQIQTFKAAADHADFKSTTSVPSTGSSRPDTPAFTASSNSASEPKLHIDLHIHLPENKSRRDYEYIFEDIARYIFGRDVGSAEDDRD